MINGGSEGQIFISHPYTNNAFFFLITIDFFLNKLPEISEYV